MPTPFELLSDPVAQAILGLYAALVLWEAMFPARVLPAIRYWRTKGLLAFAAYFLLSSYLPLWWSAALADWQLFDLTALGTWRGALVGVLIYEAGMYAWHRGMHGSTLLWRGFHQMHHSAERIDTFGAFWFSPFDMIGWTALFSICLTLGVGLTAEATTLVLLATTFFSVFQHANIRTPRWLGYLIQRPESHSYHHARGLHAGNYADLPVFDALFGTLHNPSGFAAEAGFYDGASQRLPEMLRGIDVAQPRRA
jgi:sterol desaturase/sphingolipid hydroxylase (fatty acid hydroxylase superfamily)